MDWVSCIFFAVKEISDREEDKESTSTKNPVKNRRLVYNKNGLDRLLYTSGNAAYYAKNIFDLPERMQMNWDLMVEHIKKNFNSQN